METKERIIIRSIELFTKSGIRYVTMDQIAGEAGTSKRTLYEIFRDKDDLLQQCIEKMAERNEAEMEQIIGASNNTIEALYLIGQHAEKKKSSVNHLFFEDIEKLYPDLRKLFIKKGRSGEYPISYRILKKGIDEGIFRKEINLEIVDIFVHEMMKICHNSQLFPENIETPEIVKNIVIPYFIGISTVRGRELLDKHFPVERN